MEWWRNERAGAVRVKAPIYLDYQATTPIDPRVREAMLPLLGEEAFGNPHSDHWYGWRAAKAIDEAAKKVAALLGADPGEIVFTSGATEANNLAIRGLAMSQSPARTQILTTAIEHKCVLNSAILLCRQGFVVEFVPIDEVGRVDCDALESMLSDKTALVSVMTANNEIGTIQPIEKIGALCRARGIPFHTDAAQAAGRVPIDAESIGADLISLSAHKIYGPKGIGALYVSRYCPVELEPLVVGGAQQHGLRAGTVSPLLCAGLGEACRLARLEMVRDRAHCEVLRDAFVSKLSSRVEIKVNGATESRLPGNLNVQIPGSDASSLLASLQDRIAASTGSACNSGLIEPSYVLTALGLTLEEANSSIRFGFGRFTTIEEVESAATMLAERVEHYSRDLAVG